MRVLVSARLAALSGLRYILIWATVASFSGSLVVFPLARYCLAFGCLFGALRGKGAPWRGVRGLQPYMVFRRDFGVRQSSVSRRAVRGAVYQHGRVLSGRDPSSQI